MPKVAITPKSTLIVTRHFPPILNGPSIVLSRLVKHWPQNSISVFTRHCNGVCESIDPASCLDNIPITRFPWNIDFTRRIDRIKEFWHIKRLSDAIYRQALTAEADVILGCTDDGPFFISSYLAAKKLNLPLVVYMLDLYEEGRRSRIQKFFARLYEQKILLYASEVLAMSERMQDYYKHKYDIDAILVPHTIERHNIVDKLRSVGQREFVKRPMKIVFTGHTTAAQYDSINRLVKLVGDSGKEFTLKLCVPARNTTAGDFGTGRMPSNVEVKSLNRQKVIDAQRSADVLFLPYSFDNPYPDVIRTASPGKLPEYLAAGRPIIYYGPEYGYVKWYLDRVKAALCVTSAEGEALLHALRRLRNDRDLRECLSKNALKAARLHSAEVIGEKVWSTIQNIDSGCRKQ